MTGYQVDLLKAEFSNGASKDKLKMLLISAIDVIKEYKNTTKDDILVILALAIMLDAEKEAEKFVVANKQVIAEDRLLDCFSEYIKTGKCEWNETLKLSNEYVELNKVFNSMNKEIALKNYLKEWYNNHREYAWYGSDIRDTDIYCGYWSFESAAIAKMLELNEMELEKCEYYPKI